LVPRAGTLLGVERNRKRGIRPMSQPRTPYRYTPTCNVKGCDQPARYKVAAPWTDGVQKELRNYGVYCADHSEGQLELARDRQAKVRMVPGEEVGEMRLYELVHGRRDADLVPIA
jgi:hypothetical protein